MSFFADEEASKSSLYVRADRSWSIAYSANSKHCKGIPLIVLLTISCNRLPPIRPDVLLDFSSF